MKFVKVISTAALFGQGINRSDISRDDLNNFIGSKSAKFLKVWDEAKEYGSNLTLSWTWPAFFVPIIWLLYRKMYREGCAVIILITAILFVPKISIVILTAVHVAIAALAKDWYFRSANRKIQKVKEKQVSQGEISEQLAKEGGTSITGIFVGGSVYLGLLWLVFGALFVLLYRLMPLLKTVPN